MAEDMHSIPLFQLPDFAARRPGDIRRSATSASVAARCGTRSPGRRARRSQSGPGPALARPRRRPADRPSPSSLTSITAAGERTVSVFRFIVRRLLDRDPAADRRVVPVLRADHRDGRPAGRVEAAAAPHRGRDRRRLPAIGYDKPVLERYVDWAGGFVAGDWKTTVTPGNGTVDVREEIGKAFWVTARLVIGAEIIAVLLGMMVGVIGAVRQYSVVRLHARPGWRSLLFSMPLFCLAVLLKFGGIELNDWLESIGLGPLDRHRRATRRGLHRRVLRADLLLQRGLHPAHAVPGGHPVRALQPVPAGVHVGHVERRLRAHRPGQGAQPRAG